MTKGTVLSNLMQAVEKTLYGRLRLEYQQEEIEFLKRNAALQGHRHLCFRYSGVVYGRGVYLKAKTPLPRPVPSLHPDLVEAFAAHLKNMKDLVQDEQNWVLSFLVTLIGDAESFGDLLAVLPEVFHSTLTPYRHHFLYQEQRMSANEVAAFKEQYAPYLDKILSRMMTNLLTG